MNELNVGGPICWGPAEMRQGIESFKVCLRRFSVSKSIEVTMCAKNFFFLVFLGMHPWHMEVSRLGVESELQLPAYARTTATPDPSHACNLHHSSQQWGILNPLSEARDRTCILMDAVTFISPSHDGNSSLFFFN